MMGPGFTHCVGMINSTQSPPQFQTEVVENSANGTVPTRVLHVWMRDGDSCPFCSRKNQDRLQTRISIFCNPSVQDIPIILPLDGEKVRRLSIVLLDIHSRKVQFMANGEINVGIEHRSACGVDVPAPQLPSIFVHPTHRLRLSIGDILLI
jgi:hypothetical protein